MNETQGRKGLNVRAVVGVAGPLANGLENRREGGRGWGEGAADDGSKGRRRRERKAL